jgi:hypothetical protein
VVLPAEVADVVRGLVEPELEAPHVHRPTGEHVLDQFVCAALVAPPEGDGLELLTVRREDGVLLRTVFARAVVEEQTYARNFGCAMVGSPPSVWKEKGTAPRKERSVRGNSSKAFRWRAAALRS